MRYQSRLVKELLVYDIIATRIGVRKGSKREILRLPSFTGIFEGNKQKKLLPHCMATFSNSHEIFCDANHI